MAWIESHQELRLAPKTRKAARSLGISVPEMIGHLHLLWWWAVDYAPTGDLSPFEDYEIAEAAMWEGDGDVFVTSLTSCGNGGFIDAERHIHNWDHYTGRLVEMREKNAERQRRYRDKAKPQAKKPESVTSPLRNGATVSKETGGEPPSTGSERDWEGEARTVEGHHQPSIDLLSEFAIETWGQERLGRKFVGRLVKGKKDFGVQRMMTALLEVRDVGAAGHPLDLAARYATHHFQANTNGHAPPSKPQFKPNEIPDEFKPVYRPSDDEGWDKTRTAIYQACATGEIGTFSDVVNVLEYPLIEHDVYQWVFECNGPCPPSGAANLYGPKILDYIGRVTGRATDLWDPNWNPCIEYRKTGGETVQWSRKNAPKAIMLPDKGQGHHQARGHG